MNTSIPATSIELAWACITETTCKQISVAYRYRFGPQTKCTISASSREEAVSILSALCKAHPYLVEVGNPAYNVNFLVVNPRAILHLRHHDTTGDTILIVDVENNVDDGSDCYPFDGFDISFNPMTVNLGVRQEKQAQQLLNHLYSLAASDTPDSEDWVWSHENAAVTKKGHDRNAAFFAAARKHSGQFI